MLQGMDCEEEKKDKRVYKEVEMFEELNNG